jgi:anti-sigma B factor antagonist
VRILRLTGPFTLSHDVRFPDISYAKGPAAVTIIDLSGVPYMDSAALGALLGFHVSCQREGRRSALTGVSGRLQTLFQVAGVNGFLVRYDTPEQAEAQLAGVTTA